MIVETVPIEGLTTNPVVPKIEAEVSGVPRRRFLGLLGSRRFKARPQNMGMQTSYFARHCTQSTTGHQNLPRADSAERR